MFSVGGASICRFILLILNRVYKGPAVSFTVECTAKEISRWCCICPPGRLGGYATFQFILAHALGGGDLFTCQRVLHGQCLCPRLERQCCPCRSSYLCGCVCFHVLARTPEFACKSAISREWQVFSSAASFRSLQPGRCSRVSEFSKMSNFASSKRDITYHHRAKPDTRCCCSCMHTEASTN